MVNVAVCGACGRMGGRIIQLVLEDEELTLVAAVEAPAHPRLGEDAGAVCGMGEAGVRITDTLDAEADVLVDFSAPHEAVIKRAEYCATHGIGMAIGTTGLSEKHLSAIKKASQKVPCLVCPNMSVGVNVLFELVGKVAVALGADYDIEIVEAHHRFKKDAPSGTALRLAEKLAEATGRNLAQDALYGRHGQVGERGRNEIGIHAVRAGDIVGDHTVIFSNLGERLELTHQAHTRDTFANGAIRAAKFLAGKPPGMYEIKDVLGL